MVSHSGNSSLAVHVLSVRVVISPRTTLCPQEVPQTLLRKCFPFAINGNVTLGSILGVYSKFDSLRGTRIGFRTLKTWTASEGQEEDSVECAYPSAHTLAFNSQRTQHLDSPFLLAVVSRRELVGGWWT
jgi:hypothetical protein